MVGEIPWILISVFGLLLLFLVFYISFKKKKKLETDYRAFYLIGIIWVFVGIINLIQDEDSFFFIMGLVFLAIGLTNKDKWKEQKSLIEDKNKRLIVLGLIITLLLGLFFFILLRRS